jgi:hypothetical protein
MARPKSVLPKLVVDKAARKHACQHSKLHDVAKDEVRLRVYDSRSDEKYCRACAIKFLNSDIAELQGLVAQLQAET